MALAMVAIVGRPNVGKSTLVNRLAGASEAIVHETSGVTRDRSYHRTGWNGRDFMLVDTGGIEAATADAFGASIRDQAYLAADEADVIVLMVDSRTGPVGDDEEVAAHLKRSGKPVLLTVNKLDEPAREEAMHEFWALGLGEPYPVSALHGHGTGDLLDAIVEALPEPEEHVEDEAVDVAIVGRPNAGKSSLLNALVGGERAIVSDVAGTTRDAIDTLVRSGERAYRLIDTAGLRRRAQIDQAVEYYGFVRAMRALDRAEVALLVIDCEIGITTQDQRIASFAAEKGCALALLLNKWDLVQTEDQRADLEYDLAEKMGFVGYAPVLRISATTRRGVDRVFELVDTVEGSYSATLTTKQLNNLIADIRGTGHTVSRADKTLRLKYATQTRTRPPGITFFVNHPKLVDPTYQRYLENRVREWFPLTGTPLVLRFRRSE
jgi:ribosome-associated GTPase EngA